MASAFSTAHRAYVKSLYKRMLKNELDWTIRHDLFRGRALAIRAEFDRNRCAPRARSKRAGPTTRIQ
jgi:NADH dehydrogenase (ubiquinone) 1 beta subcomplex subunit 9